MDQAERAKQDRRIERWEVWVTLWLARVFSYLNQFAGMAMPQGLERWFESILKILTQAVLGIIMLKVTAKLKPAPPPTRRCYKRPPPFVMCASAPCSARICAGPSKAAR